MVERFRQSFCTGVCICLASLVGCAFSKPTEIKHYQTIAADPNRNTSLAKKQHEKALKIIERAANERNYECSCVAKFQCNVHKAEQLLQDALVADVRFGPAHNTLGLLYYHQRRLYLAAWEFEFASDLMPSRAEPLNNLGMVYEEADQIEQSLGYYAMAVEIEPGNPAYMGNLARAHLRSGKDLDLIRGMLHQLLLNDTRPEWIAWAEDLLGKSPFSFGADPAASHSPVPVGLGASPQPSTSGKPFEELPLPSSRLHDN